MNTFLIATIMLGVALLTYIFITLGLINNPPTLNNNIREILLNIISSLPILMAACLISMAICEKK
jgi:hypothetical protein